MEEFEEPSAVKKILIVFLGLFLIVLMLSYFLTSSSVWNVIYGFVESSKLKEQTVKIDRESKLIFNNESLEVLNKLYDENLDREFKVCLKGFKVGETYYIEETIQPKTFLQEFNRVVAEPCSEEYLVSLHTHPFKHCLPSQIDLKNFEKFKEKNEDVMMAIMCERDRFGFYR